MMNLISSTKLCITNIPLHCIELVLLALLTKVSSMILSYQRIILGKRKNISWYYNSIGFSMWLVSAIIRTLTITYSTYTLLIISETTWLLGLAFIAYGFYRGLHTFYKVPDDILKYRRIVVNLITLLLGLTLLVMILINLNTETDTIIWPNVIKMITLIHVIMCICTTKIVAEGAIALHGSVLFKGFVFITIGFYILSLDSLIYPQLCYIIGYILITLGVFIYFKEKTIIV